MVPCHVRRARLLPPHPGGDRGLQQRNTSLLLTPVCLRRLELHPRAMPCAHQEAPMEHPTPGNRTVPKKWRGSHSLGQTPWASPRPGRGHYAGTVNESQAPGIHRVPASQLLMKHVTGRGGPDQVSRYYPWPQCPWPRAQSSNQGPPPLQLQKLCVRALVFTRQKGSDRPKTACPLGASQAQQ